MPLISFPQYHEEVSGNYLIICFRNNNADAETQQGKVMCSTFHDFTWRSRGSNPVFLIQDPMFLLPQPTFKTRWWTDWQAHTSWHKWCRQNCWQLFMGHRFWVLFWNVPPRSAHVPLVWYDTRKQQWKRQLMKTNRACCSGQELIPYFKLQNENSMRWLALSCLPRIVVFGAEVLNWRPPSSRLSH